MKKETINLINSMKKKCEFLNRDLGKLKQTLEEDKENGIQQSKN